MLKVPENIQPKSIDLSQYEIKLNSKYKEPDPVFQIMQEENDTYEYYTFGTRGNFIAVKGQMKGRKTTFLTMMAAACINAPRLTLKKIKCISKGNSVYFDTEQARHHSYRIIKNAHELADNKDNELKLFALRELDIRDKLTSIQNYIEKTENLQVVFIDGVLDLVLEMNSEVLASELTSWLLTVTAKKNILIALIIHENFGGVKATGHIGSSVLRRAESIINVNWQETEKYYSIVKCEYVRGQYWFDDFRIYIDKQSGIPAVDGTYDKELATKRIKSPY